MDALKIKLLSELLNHLSGSQGKDLKGLMDDEKPSDEMSPMGMKPGMGKPKGIAIEKVSILGKGKPNPLGGMDDKDDQDDKGQMNGMDQDDSKPSFDDQAKHAVDEITKPSQNGMPGEDEMTDSELEELLKKYLS